MDRQNAIYGFWWTPSVYRICFGVADISIKVFGDTKNRARGTSKRERKSWCVWRNSLAENSPAIARDGLLFYCLSSVWTFTLHHENFNSSVMKKMGWYCQTGAANGKKSVVILCAIVKNLIWLYRRRHPPLIQHFQSFFRLIQFIRKVRFLFTFFHSTNPNLKTCTHQIRCLTFWLNFGCRLKDFRALIYVF